MTAVLTSEWHRQQIAAFEKVRPTYEVYAAVLRRELGRACAVAVPAVVVQARAKTIPSFAEKCVRKFAKYPDPVNQFTDLCGARVIVQTLEHVAAVCDFIAANFVVLERDDKSANLQVDQFGYRDTHFIVTLRADGTLQLSAAERTAIGGHRAEIQVRTLVQHAWADILHDRLYKTPLRLSAEIRRAGNLLAAVMEEGDRGFSRLAGEVDGMIANYAANALPADVEKEIEIQQLLLASADAEGKPVIALRLARLIAAQGRWDEIIAILTPHQETPAPLGLEIRSELGFAQCWFYRARTDSAGFRDGQNLLRRVDREATAPATSVVLDRRQLRCVQARALARLGWSCAAVEEQAADARAYLARAAELEPDNPYHFVEMLGWELHFAPGTGLLAGFRATIRRALAACMEHARGGTELPAAYFTAAKLHFLLEEPDAALNAYARGVRFCVAREGLAQPDLLDGEIAWLTRINAGRRPPADQQTAIALLKLAKAITTRAVSDASAARPTGASPVLIVAGGAARHPAAALARISTTLTAALAAFRGLVISGGTTAGVPGCVGAAAAELARTGQKHFRLRGYIPRLLPHDGQKHPSYDEIIVSGEQEFSAQQVLDSWRDILELAHAPADVLVLGFGGGRIAAFEYRLALALGATVGLVRGTGGSADELLADPLWARLPALYPLPDDPQTIRALVAPAEAPYPADVLTVMAQAFHERYRSKGARKIQPDNLKPWELLPPTYQAANREQAGYAVRILQQVGFGVREVAGRPVLFTGFTAAEIEAMAELEHGRWNVERLRDGWRPGPRDDARKQHDSLVAWDALPESVKTYDRDAVRAFPEILAQAGLEVIRPSAVPP